VQKRDPFFWQRATLLAVAAAASTFAIVWVQPWTQLTGQPVALSKTQPPQAKNSPASASSELAAKGLKAQTLSKLIAQVQQEAKVQLLSFSIPTEFQGKVLEDVPLETKDKAIALTFDDGPSPPYTEEILDILKKNNIKATFFVIGQNLKAYPQLGQKIVAEGHVIANHTWSHSYRQFSPSGAAHEIDATAAMIYKVTGVQPSIFRPPGGFLHNGVADYAKQQKYFVALWSADANDWKRPSPEALANNVLRESRSGGMALMHDGGGERSHTVKALPTIIAELKKRGYRFVTVPELLEMQDKESKAKVAKSKATVKTAQQSPTPSPNNKVEAKTQPSL
jgi:peptidoglycan/xylan/chitin deacetylase (PgdA/CDA1 family)